jgi:hypothetical protein
MKKIFWYFILLGSMNCLVMCQENKGIGGYPDNYSVDSNGKYTHVDTSYFDNFVKDLQNRKIADRGNFPHKKKHNVSY